MADEATRWRHGYRPAGGCPLRQGGEGVAPLAQELGGSGTCHQGPPVIGLLVGACLSGTQLYQGPKPNKALRGTWRTWKLS